MIKFSNLIVVVANTVLLVAGLAALGFGISFILEGNTHCQKVLTNPLLIWGGFLTAVALLGLIGTLCKNNCIMIVYLTLTFLMILALIALTVFVFLVTNPTAGKVLSDRGIKEHKTWDFSNWLRDYVVNDQNWNQIKSCLIDANVCGNVENANDFNAKSFVFFKRTLPTVQAGCCNPPTECGFHQKNATFWEVPKTGPVTKDHDCKTWSNNPLELCYDCNSCKGGILASFKKDWRSLAIINLVFIGVIILVYSIGCCAKRNNKKWSKKYGHA